MWMRRRLGLDVFLNEEKRRSACGSFLAGPPQKEPKSAAVIARPPMCFVSKNLIQASSFLPVMLRQNRDAAGRVVSF